MTSEAMRRWLAQPPEVRSITVSGQDIARFALAVGASDPAHFDSDVARSRGYADVIAPTLYYVALRTNVFNLVPSAELHDEGTPRRDIPPLVFTQAMAGGTQAQLFRPFVAGERVRCSRQATSMSAKTGRSGPLTFIDFRFEYVDSGSGPIAIERFTRVFR